MLKNVTIKNSECCGDFVMKLMISPTFYYSALTSKHFGNHGLNGGLVSQKLILDMWIIFRKIFYLGFVGSNSITDDLNYCILYAKYYIYIQRLFNQNKLDVDAYLTLLKNTLTIEQQTSINNNKLDKFEKNSIAYDQL